MKKSFIRVFLLIIFSLLLLPNISVFGLVNANIIDQGDVTWNPTPGVSILNTQGQSFRPSVNNISRIDFVLYYQISGGGDPTVYICDTYDGDTPTAGEILVEFTFASFLLTNQTDDWKGIILEDPPFSSALTVTPGQDYWLVFEGGTPSAPYYLGIDMTDPYDNGISYNHPTGDHLFRTYYYNNTGSHILDQGDITWNPTPGVSILNTQGQSFRPTENNISRIDFVLYYQISGGGDPIVYICDTYDGDTPTAGEILAEITFSSLLLTNQTDDWKGIILEDPPYSSAITVTPGQEYWLVFEGGTPSAPYYLGIDLASPYDNGESYYHSTSDHLFRTHYSEASISEFTSPLILFFGLLIMIPLIKRRLCVND